MHSQGAQPSWIPQQAAQPHSENQRALKSKHHSLPLEDSSLQESLCFTEQTL